LHLVISSITQKLSFGQVLGRPKSGTQFCPDQRAVTVKKFHFDSDSVDIFCIAMQVKLPELFCILKRCV
jgi:hypothetical protein